MGVLNNTSAFRNAILGSAPVAKTGVTLSVATLPAFTVTGGEALITGFWLRVTTSITTAGGTVAVNLVPTSGVTLTLVTATDLGTVNTTAGTVVGLDRAAAASPSFLRGGRITLEGLVTTGTINLVGAGAIATGVVNAYLTWVPLTDGALIVAA